MNLLPTKFQAKRMLSARYGFRYPILPFKAGVKLYQKLGHEIFKPKIGGQDVIYFHIPKAAGSSIGKLLWQTDKIGHFPYFIYKMACEKSYNEAYKFSVVRCPYERLASAYYFLVNGGKGELDVASYDKYIKRFDGFEQFVMGLNSKLCYSVIHLVPQNYFICEGKKIIVNDLGKLEDIENFMPEVCSKIGIPFELHVENRTERQVVNYKDLFTQRMKARVVDIYRHDFDIFGYDSN